jgi:hypothetical protein
LVRRRSVKSSSLGFPNASMGCDPANRLCRHLQY